MSLSFAARTSEIVPFLAMEVMERGMAMAREGIAIAQLGVGEPGFDPAPEVVEAAASALREGRTHYTDSRGLYALREAIAEDCLRRRGISVDVDRILVTNGTSPAILMTLELLLDPGDEILVPTPHYPCYPNMIALTGARSVFVPTYAKDGFAIDVDRVRASVTPRTKAILLASPANPTGAIQSRATVEGLAALGLPILSDEIYDGLVFDGAEVTSPLGLADDCFVFDGFSKRHAMTGFRLGYVVVPAAATRPLQSLQQNLFISAADFVQYAGLAALRHGAAHLESMRATLARRREKLVAGLRRLGFGIDVAPRGAFYVLADARRFGEDSLDLAFRILERAHVATGPGRDFGEIAEGFLRFSYAGSDEDLEIGLARLAEALPDLASR